MPREELVNEVIDSYSNAGRLLKAYLFDKGTYDGLGVSQLHLLFCVATWTPAPTQKVLAKYMHITPGALSQQIEPLVEAGLLTRVASKEDRRSLHIKLTAEGKSKLHTIKAERNKLFAGLLDSFSSDELEAMLMAQQKMYYALEGLYEKGKENHHVS